MGKKKEVKPLGNILDSYLRLHGVQDKYLAAKIVNNWDDIAGILTAKNTEEIFVENSILYVKIESAPLRYELNLIKVQLKEKINKYLERNLIRDIVIY